MAFLVFASSASSAGAAMKCVGVYGKYQTADQYARSFGIQEGKDYWSRRLWKQYLRKWDMNKSYTERSFEKRIEDSYKLLERIRSRQENRDQRDRDFSQRPDEIMAWTEKKLMRQGLKGYLLNIPANQKLPARIYSKVQRIFETKPMRLLYHILMGTLPNRADKEIPTELLAKIVIDGIDPHFGTLSKLFYFEGQNRIETWKSIQTTVKYLSLTISAMTMFHQMEKQLETQAQQTKEAVMTELESMDKGLSEIERMLDAGEFDS